MLDIPSSVKIGGGYASSNWPARTIGAIVTKRSTVANTSHNLAQHPSAGSLFNAINQWLQNH